MWLHLCSTKLKFNRVCTSHNFLKLGLAFLEGEMAKPNLKKLQEVQTWMVLVWLGGLVIDTGSCSKIFLMIDSDGIWLPFTFRNIPWLAEYYNIVIEWAKCHQTGLLITRPLEINNEFLRYHVRMLWIL